MVNYSTVQERFFYNLLRKIRRNEYDGEDRFYVFYEREDRDAMRIFGPPLGELYYREAKCLSIYYQRDAKNIPEDIIKCYTHYVRSNMAYDGKELVPIRIVDNNWEQYAEFVKERQQRGLDIAVQSTIFV